MNPKINLNIQEASIAAVQNGYRIIHTPSAEMENILEKIMLKGIELSGKRPVGVFVYKPFNEKRKFKETTTLFSTKPEEKIQEKIYIGVSVYLLNSIRADEKYFSFGVISYLFQISKMLQWKYDCLSGVYFLNLISKYYDYQDEEFSNDKSRIN